VKMLVIHPRMSIFGGGERVCLHTIKALAEDGHSVSLLSEKFDWNRVHQIFGLQGFLINQIEMDLKDYMPEFRTPVRKFMAYQRLLHYNYHEYKLAHKLNLADYDLILSTQDVAYVIPTDRLTVQYCHFPEYLYHREEKPNSLFWKLYYWPIRKFYRRKLDAVDFFIANSNFTKEVIQERWGKKAVVIYPPCSTSAFCSSNRKEDKVVSIGRILPEKRFELLFEAARKLPHVKFEIIGGLTEEYVGYYRKLFSSKPKNVSLVADAPFKILREELASSKVYMHCMKNEHFGISIVEAMASGCIPIVHNSGGAKEIVDEDVGYRWNEVDEAVEQIQTVLEDDNVREEKSTNAIKSSKLFSAPIFEKKIKEMVRQIA